MKTGRLIRLFLLIPGNLLALMLAYLGLQCIPTHLLGWLLFVLGIAYLAGGAIYFWPAHAPLISRSDHARRDEQGDRSFWLIIPGFVCVFFIPPIEYLYLGSDERASPVVQATGLLLILLGLAMRTWTRLSLKEQYTGHIQVVQGGHLFQGGPYRYVRHPGYAGYLLFCLGLVVGFGSILGAATLFLVLLPGLCYRICVEERLLALEFGQSFQEYVGRTKRLIPGLW